ncbi:nineTeen Complex (NTC) component [Zygosaccharomyces mellis]|uniref:Pre-mRNA-splicing factor ISY1 n=1 Tax=Zygosaccharomyces mellis TaxID=42258 RepID=A0A4C2E8D9_9SACH|nr:nineTeen Complex (NTC) component [Zygosaccharomyces mellis]
MSRNAEKSSSVLVRFQELKAEETGGFKDFSRYRRPKRVASVKNLKDALEWRGQVAKEISDKLTRIYDPSLNDWQVEDLNDQLNNLVKERNRWDWHIQKDLGGAKPRKTGTVNGKLIAGKRYFGRALELPEVQKVLKEQEESKKSNQELVNTKLIPKDYNDDYYGTTQDVPELRQYESSWTPVLRRHYGRRDTGCDTLKGDINIPDLKDMERWLVERKKQKLLKELGL